MAEEETLKVVKKSTAVVKKAPSRRATTTKKTQPRKIKGRSATASVAVAKFPRHSVERALRIPRAIYNQNAGKPATAIDAAKFTGLTSAAGPFSVELSSSKKYGFLSTDGKNLVLTDRARRAIAPQSETDQVNAFREAILDAPEIKDVYNFYRGENVPDEPFFFNVLTEQFHIPPDKIIEFRDVFNESMLSADLLDQAGDRARLVDIGRDGPSGAGNVTRPRPHRTVLTSGESCFVMQPFAEPYGRYYGLIFKPAIEQSGLIPVRADTDMFGTGKIMDQVWRGITSAKVLVAELTSRNANVFYELGLAHALKKPVVLVSSNQEDVPFDLKHIRVILYDTSDPFWGQKLIDKIADNIRSAIDNPEDAIFQIET